LDCRLKSYKSYLCHSHSRLSSDDNFVKKQTATSVSTFAPTSSIGAISAAKETMSPATLQRLASLQTSQEKNPQAPITHKARPGRSWSSSSGAQSALESRCGKASSSKCINSLVYQFFGEPR